MGLNLGTGLGGGLNLAWPGTSGTNAGIATGPRTAAAQGFGTSASATGRQVSSLALGVLTVGTLALGGLLFIWWSLPRQGQGKEREGMSPFIKGLLVGVVGYWAVQHFTGMGVTGKGATG